MHLLYDIFHNNVNMFCLLFTMIFVNIMIFSSSVDYDGTFVVSYIFLYFVYNSGITFLKIRNKKSNNINIQSFICYYKKSWTCKTVLS